MSDDKRAKIKEAIRQLHAGVAPELVKEKFKDVFEGTTALEIAKIEDELVKEGMKREKMQKLCDVHLAVFKDQIERQRPDLKPSQPISILLEEHKIMTKMAEDLLSYAAKIRQVTEEKYIKEDIHQVEHLIADFTDAEKHYLREENVLFPMLEKYGITEPPRIMWMEHNQIREIKKRLRALIADFRPEGFEGFKQALWEESNELVNKLYNHFYKENNILFPVALSAITEQEWGEIQEEFDSIGYCSFTPPQLTVPPKKEGAAQPTAPEGAVSFDFGSLYPAQLSALLNTLPVEITFIDQDEIVRYFNKPKKMIFIRTKAVIGRKVQNCHPAKSLDTVMKIIQAFKSGAKDSAEFWITLNGRFIYIRFFAVRDTEGKYLGTAEVVQDVTDIRDLQGEKRLLDWSD